MKKVIKRTIILILIAIMGIFAFGAGIYYERHTQKVLEGKKEITSTIAVVNMDEGIVIDEAQINYASQLTSFPNDNFVITGLNDAKSGIENGIYAAYVIIPETFSNAVTSLENNPQKISVKYKFNTNLDEEVEIQVVNDINAYINSLNSNISYMYIDAILDEFHRVQDDSITILNNDNAELIQLENVDASQLIAVVEPVEEKTVEFDVQPVVLDTYTNQNDGIMSALMTGYSEASQKGRDEFDKVHNDNSEVEKAADDFFTLYETVIQDTANNQDAHLSTGQTNLGNAIGLYNQNAAENTSYMQKEMSALIEVQRAADETSAQEQLKVILAGRNDDKEEALRTLQGQWEDTLEEVKEYAQGEVNQINSNLTSTYQAEVDEQLDNIIAAAYQQGARDALTAIEEKMSSQETVEPTEPSEPGETTETTESTEPSENVTEAPQVVYSADDIKNLHNEYLLQNLNDKVIMYLENAEGITLSEQTEDVEIDWEASGIETPSYEALCTQGDGRDEGGKDDSSEEETVEPTIILKVCDEANSEAVGKLAESFTELFSLEEDKQRINNVIQTDFKDVLLNENNTQMGRLAESRDVLDKKMSIYEKSLSEFDPYIYIERANLTSYLDDIEANSTDMMSAVQQNNAEHTAYVADVYSVTTENATQLKNALNAADKQTAINVEKCVTELIASREDINAQNANMLEGFSNTLQYTRVGSLGNVEAYDYIVNPISSQNTGQADVKVDAQISDDKEISTKDIIVFALAIGILICSAGVMIAFLQQYKLSREKQQDNS